MSQDGTRKQSKRAKITKTNDFESMRFYLLFYRFLGTPGLTREPKDSQEPPPRRLQTASKSLAKKVQYWIQFLATIITSNMAPKVVQTGQKHNPKY